MLRELQVRNLGVIDELSLLLEGGMTAVTGETGAGKTLVVEAIDLLTGGRADASLVSPGADYAEIQGRFETGNDDGNNEEIVIRRVIPKDGRSRCYINGQMATLSELATQELVDLHGQHAHQSLLRAAAQRSALDQFAQIDTTRLYELRAELRQLNEVRDDLGGDERVRAREIDLLRHQLSEIDATGIEDVNEDERLDEQEKLLANAVELQTASHAAGDLLDPDGPVTSGVAQALNHLQVDTTDTFAEAAKRLDALLAEIADLNDTIRRQSEAIDDDPETLETLRTRRSALADLKRKYGANLSEVLQYRETTAARLAELENRDEKAAQIDAQVQAAETALTAEQDSVKKQRQKAAPKLAAAVQKHLADLAMSEAQLAISVDGDAGDDVEFLLSANVGHDPRSLAKVASGGELARAMLALRLMLIAGPPTLIFDEVDAGVGGTVAHAVGAKLASLAKVPYQVLVVTHLAQVAAFADNHVLVEKSPSGKSTISAIRTLNDSEREVELSRMLSGSPESQAAQDHARELLHEARTL